MNNPIKKITAAGMTAFAIQLASGAVVPEVTGVTMTQATDSRRVTINYTLSDAPAVITLDVQTNATGDAWASIGGAAVCNAQGDVWRKVETGSRTITWHPDLSWPDHKIPAGGARAVVTAWALDNTPDYMVVDVSSAAQQNTQTYYPAVEFLPGGLLGNPDYRTSKLVMRKIMAKNVEWTMGSTTLETQRKSDREATHIAALTNNYYIGVFEITQAQWDLIQTSRLAPSYFNNAADRAMRPVENVCYNEIRNSANSTAATSSYNWPADPNPNSFLGKLKTKTGMLFDLPSDAQWEFAARAGNGDTKWGDGSGILNSDEDANMNLLGRYERNGGKVQSGTSYVAPEQSCRATSGPAIVGSYSPNAWGLYDMSGNVRELCLDWYEDNISTYSGKININPSTPAKTLSGATGYNRARRGGHWGDNASFCRPAARGATSPDARNNQDGFRVVCTAGLK